MKLQRLKVSEFRKFTSPVEIQGFAEGLNLLYGPNEAGKSTLAQALRTAFFEKHSTMGKFVQAISPTGQDDAAPVIEVDFLLGGKAAKLHKRFFKKRRANLSIGTQNWEGAEADEHLARLLGFKLAGSGTSGEDDRGIPGLLWIEQGRSPELAEPVGHARATLQERLKDIIGEVTSTNGRQVIEAVQQELGRLRTATGRDTGELRETANLLDTARAERDALKDKLTEYRDKVDALGVALEKHRQLHRHQPWVELDRKRTEAQGRLQAVQPKQNELTAKQRELEVLAQQIADLTKDHDQYQRDTKALTGQRAKLEDLAMKLADARQALQSAESDQSKAAAQRDAAKLVLNNAQRQAQRQQLVTDIERVKSDLARVKRVVETATALQGEIHRTRKDAATLQLNARELEKLRNVESDLRDVQIRLEAVATRVDFRLVDGAQVLAGTWGNVQRQTSYHATEPVTLQIPGVGEIDIVPGAGTVQELATERDRLSTERGALLTSLGMADLAAAEARYERWQKLDELITRKEGELQIHLDGQGLDELQGELNELTGRETGLNQQLTALPAENSSVTLEDADQAYQQALQDHQAAVETRHAANTGLIEVRTEHDALSNSVTTESQRLEGTEGKEQFEALKVKLAEVKDQQTRGNDSIATLQTELRELNPEGLQLDVTRYETSHRQAIVERDALDTTIRELNAFLKAQGAEGLEEQLDQAAARVDRLEKRLALYQQRANGLQLLADKLAAHQTAAKERLYAPLRAKLEPYLKIVFPGETLHVGIDDLAPIDLQRGEQRLGLGEFSHGTREQLGVLARFAYADLLKDAGQPTLLVLDDALVHTDAERLDKMKRAVHLAAQRHQVLLFTCHPDSWRDAGADQRIDVAALCSSA